MNKIAERAGALGLFVTANAIADAKLDPTQAPPDPRLVEPVADDIKRIFGQMTRRGCDPVLVTALWNKLGRRPLERALVAVDVLASSIWPTNDPLLPELRAAAKSLASARPPVGELGIDLNKFSATELMNRHALLLELSGSSTPDLLALAYEHNLSAFLELRRRGDKLFDQEPTRDSIHAYARLVALAHLPTLASVYMDWLVRDLGYRPPMLDLCEVLFDAGVAQKIPGDAIQPSDFPEAEGRDIGEYVLYRAHISVGDLDRASGLMVHNAEQRPRWGRPSSSRLDVVRAHLGTLYGHSEDITLQRVEAACSDDRTWRYGAKVRAIVAAKRQPTRAFEMVHGYVAGFGNDYETLLTVLSIGPEALKRDVARIIVREAFYLPHEPSVWKLLGALFGARAPVADEIDKRIRSQQAP
ncbi:MAG TPA: hypothetical protein VL326_14760 [Kofleriaceae bacterium]|jgi:hypothetical protein|nr:hypothetical protein [Kofleriaceae bacterium]